MMRKINCFAVSVLIASALFVFCGQKNSPTGPVPTTDENLALQVHQLVNAHRVSNGLSALTMNPVIIKQALGHSQNMASGSTSFSHNGFDARVEAIGKSINLRSAAENIAYNQGYANSAEVAVDSWLKSPGHKTNIEGNFALTGIGVAINDQQEVYFTQIFVLPR